MLRILFEWSTYVKYNKVNQSRTILPTIFQSINAKNSVGLECGNIPNDVLIFSLGHIYLVGKCQQRFAELIQGPNSCVDTISLARYAEPTEFMIQTNPNHYWLCRMRNKRDDLTILCIWPPRTIHQNRCKYSKLSSTQRPTSWLMLIAPDSVIHILFMMYALCSLIWHAKISLHRFGLYFVVIHSIFVLNVSKLPMLLTWSCKKRFPLQFECVLICMKFACAQNKKVQVTSKQC